MAQKYYTLAEVATNLGVTEDDVKAMMDRRELHGYRDGSTWKFKVEDIDQLAVQTPDLSLDEDGADVLLSEVELGDADIDASGTVIGMENANQAAQDSGIGLLDSGINLGEDLKKAPQPNIATGSSGKLLDSGIDLAGDEQPGSSKKETLDSKVAQFEDLDLTLDEDVSLADSSVGLEVGGQGSSLSGSQLELAGPDDDDLVLGGGSGAGSDVTIGGDSGISLVDPADSGISLEISPGMGGDDSLALGEEALAEGESVKTGVRKHLKTDEEFLLTPLEDVTDAEESESGSQVIALDTEGDESATMISSGQGRPRLELPAGDLLGGAPVDIGGGSPVAITPPAGAAAMPLGKAAPTVQTVLPEEPYTGLQVTSLAVCAVLLMLCGMVMYDLMRNMWSWHGAFTANSSIMDFVLGLFEK